MFNFNFFLDNLDFCYTYVHFFKKFPKKLDLKILTFNSFLNKFDFSHNKEFATS